LPLSKQTLLSIERSFESILSEKDSFVKQKIRECFGNAVVEPVSDWSLFCRVLYRGRFLGGKKGDPIRVEKGQPIGSHVWRKENWAEALREFYRQPKKNAAAVYGD
jgi:hypothetical protein